ncbi:MAG: arylsulfatase, partial [Bacteroidota bacterium]
LAKSGLLFTQHYAGNTVCAPSRSSLMTGLHTGHTPIRGNQEVKPEGQWPLADSTFTLAEMFQKSGYVTGAFGKWGLGYPGSEGDPNNQGFDQFFGYNCQRLAHNYYPYHLWDNQERIILEENADSLTGLYAPDLIHEKALNFIQENSEAAFFLFYPMITPHAELVAPEAYMEQFRGKFEPEKVYKGGKNATYYKKGAYGPQPEGHAAFAAMVKYMDDQVGDIMAELEKEGLLENTLVIFTSDNGPHQEGGADPDYFNSNGPLRGYKRDLYEGGIRVPMIASWNGSIVPDQTDHVSTFWDMMPTIAELINTESPQGIDGISFLTTLTGEGEQDQHEYLYWEFHEKGGRQAVRLGDWKGVKYNVLEPDSKIELYNLATDIEEQNNLADEHPEIVQKIGELFISSRTESEVFTFKSKAFKK